MTAEEFKYQVMPYSRKLYPMLIRILKNEDDTKDALQELMLKLWGKRDEIVKCMNQNSYIISVARNYSFDLLRKKRLIIMDEKETARKTNLMTAEPGHDLNEKYEFVRKIISELPDKYQTVIQMRDIDGFEFEEISLFTGLEIPHIRVILSRARQVVKNKIEKIYSYEAI